MTEIAVSGFNDIHQRLLERKEQRLYRRPEVVEGRQGPRLTVGGRSFLNFCSNDYLGLADDERVRAAFKQGIEDWGVGSGAAHLVSGHTAAHHQLEMALAEFTERPRCLLFSSGYATNMGVINGLMTRGDHVFEDALNHASLLDGGWISRAHFNRFGHCEIEQLSHQLDHCRASSRRKLVVSDGTFSMDGDLCDLERLSTLSRQHQAWLMIDDAHGFGVHGEHGQGLVAQQGFDQHSVQVLVGTLGKALGTYGGFVVGSEELIETLIQKARTYIYSTAPPPAIAVASLKSLEISRTENWRRERLQELINRFRAGANNMGLELSASACPIQPVLLGDSQSALDYSAALEEQGIWVTAIRPPTVPEGTSRLRITLTANHCNEDVDQLLNALKTARDKLEEAP